MSLGRLALWVTLMVGLTIMWVRYGATTTAAALLTVVSGGAAVVEVVAAWRSRFRRVKSSGPEQLTAAAEALAREVRTQWEAEAGRRLIQDAGELVVRWRGDKMAGDLDELVTSYLDAPRRMVVVGEPGSGKSGLCVLLTLELLRRPEPPRIPVVLQISSWNPEENLYTWLIRSIHENYPFLGNVSRFGTTAVRDLVAQHRILPVLDALDEMAEDCRAKALDAIARDISGSEPFVLTCRVDEFAAANAAGTVRNALVVRLQPVDVETAAGYLLDAAADVGVDRWEPVLARLADGGPIATALRTPLMLFLTRVIYADPSTDPRELLAPPDATGIEEHLLDRFPRQAFATRPPSPLTSTKAPARRWDPADAERWLGFLAKHCGREIAWWELHRTMPVAVRITRAMAVGAVTCTPLGWLLLGLFGRPVLGILLGLAIGVIASVALSVVPQEPPRRFVPRPFRWNGLARDLGFGVIGALVGGVAVGVLYGAGYGMAIGLVFGLTFGLVRRFTEPTEPGEAVTPGSMLRGDRLAVAGATVLGALVGMLVGAVMGGVVGADTQGLIIRIDNPALVGLLGAGVGGLLGAGGLGLVVQATSAWGRFITTRVYLAQRGKAPLRLMAFLEDAHRLGVLRQLGPYYQFRHALLQDRLRQAATGVPIAPARDTAGTSQASPDRSGAETPTIGAYKGH